VNKRSVKLTLVGLLCLLVGAAGLWLVWQQVHGARDVWVAARPIAAGMVIGPDDVGKQSVQLSAGVASISASRPVTGGVALVAIPAGALLTPEEVGDAMPADDTVLVSVVVDVGRAPVGALDVGRAVTLLGPSGEPVAAVVASSPQLMLDAAHHRFDVKVAMGDAPHLAQWVAGGTVIVVVP